MKHSLNLHDEYLESHVKSNEPGRVSVMARDDGPYRPSHLGGVKQAWDVLGLVFTLENV